jgi:hypothetical protein
MYEPTITVLSTSLLGLTTPTNSSPTVLLRPTSSLMPHFVVKVLFLCARNA